MSRKKTEAEKPKASLTRDDVIKDLVNCGYVQSADLADRFGDPSTLNPLLDPDIVGPAGIFTLDEFDSESEFQKTASIMKLVVNGFSGAGTVTMGTKCWPVLHQSTRCSPSISQCNTRAQSARQALAIVTPEQSTLSKC